MNIACIGYRDWALAIYDELSASTEHNYLIVRSEKEYDESMVRHFEPDLILFYGWSQKIEESLLNDIPCIMLHPSPLPKYRGGSPIQNQIIAGEKHSAVTLFLMNNEIDAGPILAQVPISLEGNLSEIFSRIQSQGIKLTKIIFKTGLTSTPQDETLATYCTRRTPEQSEITQEELLNESAEYLYNKIRMLQAPYPNAFIRTSDGKKLLLTNSIVADKK